MKILTVILAAVLMTACGASMPQRHSYLKAAAGIDQPYAPVETSKVNYDGDEAMITVVSRR